MPSRKATRAAIILIALALFLNWEGKRLSQFAKSLRQNSSKPANILSKEEISRTIGQAIELGEFPEEIEIPVGTKSKLTRVQYSLDLENTQAIENLLEQYKPDFAMFVAMDPVSGQVLTMSDYVRSSKAADQTGGNLALQARFPAASVFKVVTAAAAIEKKRLLPSSVIPFDGANHTLYRRNVRNTKINRWTRWMTLKEAFAKSVNTVFGKIGAFYVGPETMDEYARKFKFNDAIAADFPVEGGVAQTHTVDSWELAEASSGFTKKNIMSPLQGAMIAAAIANHGIMMEPWIVKEVKAVETKESPEQILYSAEEKVASHAIDPMTAAHLRILMKETVEKGTSRGTFRSFLRDPYLKQIEVGGKTGSLNSNDSSGRCDWFVGYAILNGKKIAFAALTVNKDFWTVKSSYLVRKYIENYFSGDIHKMRTDAKLKNETTRHESKAHSKKILARQA